MLKTYFIGESVLLDDVLGLLDDAGHVDTVDVLGASLGGKHGQNA
jgi:hypothetical protein